MATYPYVNWDNVPTPGIASTPALIFGKQTVCRIDTLRCTNAVNNNIFVTINLLKEIDNVPVYCMIANQQFIPPYGTADIVNFSLGGPIYLGSGDTLFANSDSNIKTFDCLVCYRELSELNL
jgi:hypothetical protein